MKGTKATIEKYDWVSEWVKEWSNLDGERRAVRSVRVCVCMRGVCAFDRVWVCSAWHCAGVVGGGGQKRENNWFRVTKGVKEEEVEKWVMKEREEGVCGAKVEETDLWQKAVISIPEERVIPSTQCPCPVSAAIKKPQQPVHTALKRLNTARLEWLWPLSTPRQPRTGLKGLSKHQHGAVPRRPLLSQHTSLKPQTDRSQAKHRASAYKWAAVVSVSLSLSAYSEWFQTNPLRESLFSSFLCSLLHFWLLSFD